MNAAILWDIAPCSPYVNRRFGGNYHLHHVAPHALSCLAQLIFDPEDGGDMFPETLVHIQTTWHCIPEVDSIRAIFLTLIII
jgi:hypothetical protein